MSKPQVKLAFGQMFSPEIKTYVFETEEQKAFFLKGVEAGVGWLEYRPIIEESDGD